MLMLTFVTFYTENSVVLEDNTPASWTGPALVNTSARPESQSVFQLYSCIPVACCISHIVKMKSQSLVRE